MATPAREVELPLCLTYLIHFLNNELGSKLVGYIALGVVQEGLTLSWARSEPELTVHTVSRLETAYLAFKVAKRAHGSESARAWFIGMPGLIREGRLDEVLDLADSYALSG
jgi:hypothetical protein